jgi:protein-disulfide isomerase
MLRIWRPQRDGSAFGALLVLSLGFVAYSAYLAYVSFVVHEHVCVWCTALYGVNLALLGTAWVAARREAGGLRTAVSRDLSVAREHHGRVLGSLGVLCGLALLLVAGYPWLERRLAPESPARPSLAERITLKGGATSSRASSSAPASGSSSSAASGSSSSAASGSSSSPSAERSSAPSSGAASAPAPGRREGSAAPRRRSASNSPLLLSHTPCQGPKEADLTIVQFSDYECPFCRKAHRAMQQARQAHPDRLRLCHRHFPMDDDCNPLLDRPMHEHACEAARAALCAQRQGEFWKMHDALYEHADQHHGEALLELAEAQGLERAPFARCLDDEEIARRLGRDIAAARDRECRGTPTYVLLGPRIEKQQISGYIPKEQIDELLERIHRAGGRAELSER